ncbi:class B sortase [Ruminococcaceae bacterium OttesenSCG-928-L11]|nr:class B sortase [Ruminococcaceae bacterium OttesenSCG-928-L11]
MPAKRSHVQRRLAAKGLLHIVAAAVALGCFFPMGGYAQSNRPDSWGNDTARQASEPPKRAARQTGVSRITPARTQAVAECKEDNPDTVGWLHVPGTDIDRVVLQNPPKLENNDYYLSRDFDGSYLRDGSFCTDYRVQFGDGSRGALSRNITVYGHSWDDDPNGRLFAQLKQFRDPDFATSTPYIFFSTEAEDMAWEVFAVLDATVDLPYITPDPSNRRWLDTLDIVYDLSYYSYDTVVQPQDTVLTLSTCTFSVLGHEALPEWNDYRFVIMARLVPPDEAIKEQAVFTLNTSRTAPDDIRERIEQYHL